jgi:hypothetical protein
MGIKSTNVTGFGFDIKGVIGIAERWSALSRFIQTYHGI